MGTEIPPSDRPNLQPARPDPEFFDELPTYMPRFPWRWVILGILAAALLIWGYRYRETQRIEAMRQQILGVHKSKLSEISMRYHALKGQIESWVEQAAREGATNQFVDPRLRISGLREGDGLYLRIRASEAKDRPSIARAARAMQEDAITRCLGIAPFSVRGLYESGFFLEKEWLEALEKESDFLKLRVFDEQLARSLEIDVPRLLALLQARYFLLILELGQNRKEAPVDVFLWNIRPPSLLLRARIQARGVLIPVRIDQFIPGLKLSPAPTPPSTASAAAVDCSIASQI
ncbi:MAG: hypothetical protein NZM37_07355, partial [Sandaracinaceae bacterium]|nr:hypothetical protein [Sandaracinaceae bacterium]